MPGAVVRDITSEFAGTNSAAGLWTPGDAQPLTGNLITDLVAGDLYVNIHTPPFGPGEIRGQIQLSDGVHFTANLQGPQVNPPLAVPGTGTGSFTLTEEGLQYKITLNGLVGGPIIGADLHLGAIGVNGPPMFPLAPTFVGNSATGFIPGLPPGLRKTSADGRGLPDITDPGFPEESCAARSTCRADSDSRSGSIPARRFRPTLRRRSAPRPPRSRRRGWFWTSP